MFSMEENSSHGKKRRDPKGRGPGPPFVPPTYPGLEPPLSIPIVVWIGLAFTRDLTDPIRFGSAIRTRLGLVLKIVPVG